MNNRVRLIVLTAAFGLAGVVATGCEIIADFDRTKIDAGAAPTDGSVVADATPPDANADQSAPETGGPDAASDADATAAPDGDAAAPDAADAAVDGDAEATDAADASDAEDAG